MGAMTFAMPLTTAVTRFFGVRHPIVSAPMGGSAGGALGAAASRGGGLGMLGAASADREWSARELPVVVESAERTGTHWGVVS